MKSIKILLTLMVFMIIVSNVFAEEIIYSFDKDFPPFTFVKNGQTVGFEIDLAKAILEDSNYELKLKSGQWAEVQKNLNEGKIQITSGMAQTEERKELYNFVSIPNSRLQVRIFVKSDSRIKSFSHLENKYIGTQKGSWYADVVKDHGHEKIKLYETEKSALLALSRGEVYAFVGAAKTAYYNMRKNDIKDIVSVGTPLELKQIYFAIEKDRTDILEAFNQGFRNIRNNREYSKIYKKWFVEPVSDEQIEQLISRARKVSRFAYAPYSDFSVGAALLTKKGNIYAGCNVENAVYNLTTPALKTAILKAISSGESEFVAAVNLLPNGKLAPPAADERQLIYEFGSGTQIILYENGTYQKYLITELLPFAFDLYK